MTVQELIDELMKVEDEEPRELILKQIKEK